MAKQDSRNKDLKKGEALYLPKGTHVYSFKTEAEAFAEREADRKAGRWCDSAGETILYSSMKGHKPEDAGLVTVLSKRPKTPSDLMYTFRGGKFLVFGFSHGLNREVYFRLPKKGS